MKHNSNNGIRGSLGICQSQKTSREVLMLLGLWGALGHGFCGSCQKSRLLFIFHLGQRANKQISKFPIGVIYSSRRKEEVFQSAVSQAE